MPRDLVLIGAGGYGRELVDVARASVDPASGSEGYALLGLLDDGAPDHERLARLRVRHLGGQEVLTRLAGCAFVVAIADPGVRQRLAERAEQAGLEPATLVHPSATIGSDVELGPGSAISAGARLTTGIRVGRHVLINQNVTIGHDVVLDDYVTVLPQAAVAGAVQVGRAATIGSGATVRQQLTLGPGSFVGAGAAVVSPVPAGTVVVGVPARPLSPEPPSSR